MDHHARLEGLLAAGVKEGVGDVPSATLAHGGCSVARAQLGADLAPTGPGSPSSTDCVSKRQGQVVGGGRGVLRSPPDFTRSNWTPSWNEVQYLIWPELDRSCARGEQLTQGPGSGGDSWPGLRAHCCRECRLQLRLIAPDSCLGEVYKVHLIWMHLVIKMQNKPFPPKL